MQLCLQSSHIKKSSTLVLIDVWDIDFFFDKSILDSLKLKRMEKRR